MAYAILKTGGKQYRVSPGDSIDVEKLPLEEGETTILDQILFYTDDNDVAIGTPFVEGASVSAKVEQQFRDKKVTAFKYKRRKGYHKTKGHRRHMTRLTIESINP